MNLVFNLDGVICTPPKGIKAGIYTHMESCLPIEDTNEFKVHLLNSIPYFRYLIMGAILLLIMRYRPKGILPEKIRYS